MSFYKLFGGISGSTEPGTNPSGASSISGAETIERLCDRVQSASLIEDRRDALTEIKSLSKKYKLEVGTHAMPVLIDALDKFRDDTEICCLALDTLYNVMTTDKCDENEQKNLPADITTQFTEMLIKTSTNVNLVFDLLDEFEFQTRWSTLKLLNALILNRTESLQDLVLEIPRGVSRLMDLLNDSREVIRNDTILLLNNLTITNTNIQKIIAFESGFDRIMEIIEGEGSVVDGGIIVEDCFNLLLNLLQSNNSNQNFFKEANYIKMLCKYLDLSSATGRSTPSLGLSSELGEANGPIWTVQKTTNLNLLLKLIRCLVAPTNQHAIVADCQKAYSHFGLLHRLCALLTHSGVPPELLSEAISTVGEVIRGNTANQTLFANVQMQTDPPRPILVILLMSMINEKQPFHLRCSILYCFECFMYKNEEAKKTTVETLLPKENPSNSVNQITTGQILCGGLFAQNEIYSNWFCAVAIAHTINDSCVLKEQLLRVQLAVNPTDDGQAPSAISLMQQCMTILMESTNQNQTTVPNRYKFQTTVSLLMLMSTWLSNCPTAVNCFLGEQRNISYLISQVSATDTEDKSLIIQGLTAFLLGLGILYNTNQVEDYNVDKLRDIIKKRIGIEQFENKLEYISQHEFYTKTLKKPTFAFKCNQTNDLLFDYEFTRLFKYNETLISNILKNKNIMPASQDQLSNGLNDNAEMHRNSPNVIVAQYQQIIREQDLKLKAQYKEQLELVQNYTQLQENYTNMSAYLTEKTQHVEHLSAEKLNMQAKINTLESKISFLDNKCTEQEDELSKLKRDKGVWQEALNNEPKRSNQSSSKEVIDLKRKVNELNQEQENLLMLLQDMELKLKHYKKVIRACGQDREVSDSDDDDDAESDKARGFDNIVSNLENHIDKNLQLDSTKPSIADSINLNNNANFESLHAPDDYDVYHATNYMHEIIEQKDLSNNVSSNHSQSREDTGEEDNSSEESSCSGHHSHHHQNTKNLNYPPPTGQNMPHLKNGQTNEGIIEPQINELEVNLTENGTNLTVDSSKVPNNSITRGTNSEVPVDKVDNQQSDVNPFFAQHPFFAKQFHGPQSSSQSSQLQNYFN